MNLGTIKTDTRKLINSRLKTNGRAQPTNIKNEIEITVEK
jgi:hypothetical protein